MVKCIGKEGNKIKLSRKLFAREKQKAEAAGRRRRLKDREKGKGKRQGKKQAFFNFPFP